MAAQADTLEIEPVADGFLLLRDIHDAALGRLIASDSDMCARIRWVADAKEWRAYDHGRGVWAAVDSPVGALDDYLNSMASDYDQRALQAEAEGNEGYRKYFNRCAAKVRAKLDGSGRRSLLTSIQGITGPCLMHARAADFDSQPHLLCVRNGVLDLSTLPPTLKPHEPAHLMTRSAGVAYDPKADCPRYMEALQRSQRGDMDRANYVLGVIARGLLGGQSESVWNYQGPGNNLKGAVVTPPARVLGDYATTIHPSVLLRTQHEKHSSFQGSLAGARLLVLDELPTDSCVIDSGKVKQLLSIHGFKAQTRMHGPAVHVRVAATLIIVSNPIPEFWAAEEAEHRRYTRVAFRANAARDYGVTADPMWVDNVVEEEGPGILRLLAHRAATYWANGRQLPKPESVVDDTRELWAESDPTRDFVEQCCVLSDDAVAPFSAVYSEWIQFAASNRLPQLSSRKFKHWVSQRSTPSGKCLVTEERGRNNTTCWVGLRLKAPTEIALALAQASRHSSPPPAIN